MFERIIETSDGSGNRTRITGEEIAGMISENPSVPQVYLDFMRIVGWGELKGLMIYSGLIYAHDMFGDAIPSSEGVALFGDDFRGSYFGFDFDDNAQLVTIILEEGEVEPLEVEFEELILQIIT